MVPSGGRALPGVGPSEPHRAGRTSGPERCAHSALPVGGTGAPGLPQGAHDYMVRGMMGGRRDWGGMSVGTYEIAPEEMVADIVS